VTIAILVSGLPPDRIGGAEVQAAAVACRLARQHDVTVFTRTSTVAPELARERRCTVIRRCTVARRGLRFVADVVQTLAHLARHRHHLDVILAYQTMIDGLIAVLAGRLFGVPVVVSVRSALDYQFAERGQARLFTPFVFRHADRITVQSRLMEEALLRAFESRRASPTTTELRRKICVVPNGVADTDSLPAVPREAVVFVGRLEAVKGARYAIDAMRECPNQRLVVVGDGPERASLETMARDLPNVSFVGMVPPAQVADYLARATMLVVPSLQEGQPNAMLEAMARGVPVIASRVGSVPEVVKDGETGFLVAPRDSAAIARHVRHLSADEELRGRMSVQCLRTMDRHRWPAVIDALERELRHAAGARRRGPAEAGRYDYQP
jgi:glycosyltransferase involved in cell wall biosynthesis